MTYINDMTLKSELFPPFAYTATLLTFPDSEKMIAELCKSLFIS